jgi:hypothetical protein
MRTIDLIVIHCSASPNGVWISPEQIDRWHAERGFHRNPAAIVANRPTLPHIGYHWVITADGTAWPCRAIDEVGAHAAGHNANSIGVCMVGTNAFFLRQWESLHKLIATSAYGAQERAGIRESYPIAASRAVEILAERGVRVVGHRDLSPDTDGDGVVEPHEWLKTCPGFDVAAWLARGMEPEPARVLDEHPTIALPKGPDRVMDRRAA